MSRRRIRTGAALASVSGAILAVGWVLDAHRVWEGPRELVLAPGYGLHRMDLIVLALAALPWLAIVARLIRPKRRS